MFIIIIIIIFLMLKDFISLKSHTYTEYNYSKQYLNYSG